jgi:endonuclease/exonuclease/phosphatase family metal-dependent hydrolase
MLATMRVLTWNMAYMKPGRFKSRENRRRQWALIGAISPDVALLQECRPGDLTGAAPLWMVEEYEVVGVKPRGSIGSSAVLARRSLHPAPIDQGSIPEPEQRWLDVFGAYVAVARLTVGNVEVRAASVHALAGEISEGAVTDDEHLLIKRPSLKRARYNDVAAAALLPVINGFRFVVGGDWNVARRFDVNYPAIAPAASEFFVARAGAGWHHALRKFAHDEVRTYVDPKSAAYELDHLFTDAESHAALSDCHVLSDEAFRELSDHAPLVAEFG